MGIGFIELKLAVLVLLALVAAAGGIIMAIGKGAGASGSGEVKVFKAVLAKNGFGESAIVDSEVRRLVEAWTALCAGCSEAGPPIWDEEATSKVRRAIGELNDSLRLQVHLGCIVSPAPLVDIYSQWMSASRRSQHTAEFLSLVHDVLAEEMNSW